MAIFSICTLCRLNLMVTLAKFCLLFSLQIGGIDYLSQTVLKQFSKKVEHFKDRTAEWYQISLQVIRLRNQPLLKKLFCYEGMNSIIKLRPKDNHHFNDRTYYLGFVQHEHVQFWNTFFSFKIWKKSRDFNSRPWTILHFYRYYVRIVVLYFL